MTQKVRLSATAAVVVTMEEEQSSKLVWPEVAEEWLSCGWRGARRRCGRLGQRGARSAPSGSIRLDKAKERNQWCPKGISLGTG